MAFLLGTACDGDGPSALTDGILRVEREAAALSLRNLSSSRVHYFVIERQSMAYTDWIMCAGPQCPGLSPRGEASIPFSRITGFRPDAEEVVVFSWRAFSLDGEKWQVHDTRSVVVRLR